MAAEEAFSTASSMGGFYYRNTRRRVPIGVVTGSPRVVKSPRDRRDHERPVLPRQDRGSREGRLGTEAALRLERGERLGRPRDPRALAPDGRRGGRREDPREVPERARRRLRLPRRHGDARARPSARRRRGHAAVALRARDGADPARPERAFSRDPRRRGGVIVPSIDLMGGKVVQLEQGKKKILERDDWRELAARFSLVGEINVIDLDAAMDKTGGAASPNAAIVRGGVRTPERARELVRMGARRVIVGSAAVRDGRLDRDALEKFGKAVKK